MRNVNLGKPRFDKLNTPFMIKGYWTDSKGSKIQKALVGDSVQFHIKTSNAEGEKIKVKICDSNLILDKGLSEEFDADIVNNEATLYLKLTKNIIEDIRNDGNHLELYCQCRFSNSLKVKKLADDEDNILYLYEVGYYRVDNCRIKINENTGELHWVPENCHTITYNKYKQYVEDENNWTYSNPMQPNQKDIGVKNSTLLAYFYSIKNESIKSPIDPVTLQNDGGNPNQQDTKMTLGVFAAKSTGKPDRRVKERSIETAPKVGSPQGNMRVVGAAGILVLNALTSVLEYTPIFLQYLDTENIKDHMKTLFEDVFNDVNTANQNGDIPEKYKNNSYTLLHLCNVVLFGCYKEEELYKVGKEIYRKYSIFKKK